ncbi:MAG: NrfD/PsrC family molybdoenzyme membrane anchor subunit [Bryobacteraceae bacterium]
MRVDERQRLAARPPAPGELETIVAPGTTFHGVTEQITNVVISPDVPLGWFWSFTVGLTLLLAFLVGVVALISTGVGVFGNNIPVAWAFPITNFVWWIGIGHAGTLISAILLLLNQSWRNSINRFAEAMTLFAVACAGMFPVFHLGRPWASYWILPYPNTMTVQPQFRSPLVWDVFAVSTYATVSLLFWYLGLIPDLASVRDRAKSRMEYAVYGVLALGWRGASRHWRWHKTASKLLAGLATPLVLSVHTVVSFDFTIAILPGWHSTIFPPYFVAGAIFSGFAMVLVLAIPLRKWYHLENLVTERHLENCGKLMLATGLVLAYTYAIEPFTSWYSGDTFEMFVAHNRATGPFAWSFWAVLALNVAVPQLLWWRHNRRNPVILFLIALDVLVGMWIERYMIIVTSLHRDYMPSSWNNYSATGWDNVILYGSIGLFVVLFLLFVRFFPMISMFEVRELLPFSRPGGGSEK